MIVDFNILSRRSKVVGVVNDRSLSVAVGNGLHQFTPELMNIPFIILVL